MLKQFLTYARTNYLIIILIKKNNGKTYPTYCVSGIIHVYLLMPRIYKSEIRGWNRIEHVQILLTTHKLPQPCQMFSNSISEYLRYLIMCPLTIFNIECLLWDGEKVPFKNIICKVYWTSLNLEAFTLKNRYLARNTLWTYNIEYENNFCLDWQ